MSYNPALTWGTNREITISAGGTGNRTVTVTETGHHLRSGDKVKISGSGTAIFNGIYPITVSNSNTYTYTLPEDTGVTSPAGELRAMPVSSVWLATSNAVSMDTSPKGNNAVIEVSAIAIGAIQAAEVYDFGAGYSSVPTLSTTSGDQNAELTAGLGAYATYPGYYTATQGLLSGVPKLQDNKYYQNFSYVLKTDFDVNDYRNSVKRLIHPSGLVMFGELAIRSSADVQMFHQDRRDVDDLGTIRENPGVDHQGRKYHNITLFQNAATMNVQFSTFGSNNELEIYTARHPWQAMDARLETFDDVNLQLENFRDITSIVRGNSTMYTVTEYLHGLETGDTVKFVGDESSQQFNADYTVTSAPTTNTFTIIPNVDHGAVIDQNMYDGYLYLRLEDQATGNNILLEDGNDFLMEPSAYLKSEVVSYSDVFRASATNWDSPFAGGILNEDGTEILLERGGSYLYPQIQFPEAETGVISIDVSFNSDILLEDDNGTYGWGYLLHEESAGQGNGPQRFIGLEEDTEGPDHQYESIPIVDTHVIETWYNSARNHLISEDGLSTFIMEDESLITLDTIPIIRDTGVPFIYWEGIVHYNNFITEDGLPILLEESSWLNSVFLSVEDEYGVNQNNELDVIFNLVDSTNWHIIGEDSSHIIYEDTTRMLSEEDYFKAPLVEVETEQYDTMGYHLRMENEDHLQYEDLTYALVEGRIVKPTTDEREIEITPYETTGWHLMMEDDVIHLGNEDGTRLLSEQELAANNTYADKEIIKYESTGYHIMTEYGHHIVYEDSTSGESLSRMVVDDLEFKQPDITKHYTTSEAPSDMQRWTPFNHARDQIQTWKDTVVTRTYGMQPFRPHYIKQWPSANLLFIDDRFTLEDDTGVIALEHDVVNNNFLVFEDYPEVYGDVMNPQKEVIDQIMLEDQSESEANDQSSFDYIIHEHATTADPNAETRRILLESSRTSEEGYGVENTVHQAWTVLPAYRFTKVRTRLQGTINFAADGTTGTGSGSIFTEQLRVGDEFQTANENIIAEDTGGGIMLETDERIQHEDITVAEVGGIALTADVLGIAIERFRWLITTEDTTVAAHGSHTGVTGAYSAWNTADESFWIVTGESNATLGAGTETNTAGYPGQIERESPEWENNNMLWEDGAKQLITEPQAFIVGSITNDTSLTVTRKHLGGVTDSVYQM
tara:strand:- start:431 stop:3976 length:3546 start_codon:yes stop_codon:yes gene_type:complete